MDTSGTGSDILQANDIKIIREECAETMDLNHMVQSFEEVETSVETTTKETSHDKSTREVADDMDQQENIEET